MIAKSQRLLVSQNTKCVRTNKKLFETIGVQLDGPPCEKSIVHKDHKWFWRQAATTIITWISNFVAEFPGSLTGFMGLKFDLLHCYAYFLMIFMCLGMIALTHACKFFEDEMCWWQLNIENSWKIERIFRVEFSNILVESFWGTHFYRKKSPWLFFFLIWNEIASRIDKSRICLTLFWIGLVQCHQTPLIKLELSLVIHFGGQCISREIEEGKRS